MRAAAAALALLAAGLVVGAAPATAHAACGATGDVDAWASGDASVVGVDVGVSDCNAGPIHFRGGATYYNHGDYDYTGLTGGMRIQPDGLIQPFAGIGFVAGTGNQLTPADRDGKDNDGDGVVDEPGEEAATRSEFFWYPEVGVSLSLDRNVGFTVTARRYYGEEFTGQTIVSVGARLSFP